MFSFCFALFFNVHVLYSFSFLFNCHYYFSVSVLCSLFLQFSLFSLVLYAKFNHLWYLSVWFQFLFLLLSLSYSLIRFISLLPISLGLLWSLWLMKISDRPIIFSSPIWHCGSLCIPRIVSVWLKLCLHYKRRFSSYFHTYKPCLPFS